MKLGELLVLGLTSQSTR